MLILSEFISELLELKQKPQVNAIFKTTHRSNYHTITRHYIKPKANAKTSKPTTKPAAQKL